MGGNHREGELRLSRKVIGETEETVLIDTTNKEKPSSPAESIEEEIDRLVAVPELKVSEERRQAEIEFK